jgi:hypothetical protein
VGVVCFLLGWGIQTLWGWTESDLITWPDTQIVVGEHGIVLPPNEGRLRLRNGMYGLYVVPKGSGRGVAVQAYDSEGAPLSLSLSTRSAAQTLLRMTLTSQQPKVYFALAETDIIVRISQLHTAANVPLKVDVYRSVVGELLIELNLIAEQDVWVDEHRIRLHLTPYSLPRLTAIYNPGAPLQVLGALLFVIGSTLQLWGFGFDSDEITMTDVSDDTQEK